MIIIKNKTSDPFARIPNELLSDDRIKWRDKGLLCYLLSKPEGWVLQIKDLEARSKDGKDAVYSSLRALITAGYCERKDKRDDLGKIVGVEYSIADNPCFLSYENTLGVIDGYMRSSRFDANGKKINPDMEKPDTAKPDTENPNLSKKEVSKNEELDYNIELFDTPEPKKIKKNDFPWAAVMSIFNRLRPTKKFRKSPKGVTERHMKSFWRRNGKTEGCFELLCDKITSSSYLMGLGEFEGQFPSPNPNWSWVFGKTGNGDWRSDKILLGDYDDEKMSFLVEKANMKKVILIGKPSPIEVNLAEKLSDGSLRYDKMGVDEYTGEEKFMDRRSA